MDRNLTRAMQIVVILLCVVVIGRIALGAWVWYEDRQYWDAELEWLTVGEKRHNQELAAYLDSLLRVPLRSFP